MDKIKALSLSSKSFPWIIAGSDDPCSSAATDVAVVEVQSEMAKRLSISSAQLAWINSWVTEIPIRYLH